MRGLPIRRTPGSNGAARSFCRTRRCTRSPNGAATRFGGADVPAERRLAELESSLAQVKLDPAENASLARAAPRYSAAQGTCSDFGGGGVAPPAIGGADQLGDGRSKEPAAGAGVRGSALGRSDDARCAARHRRARRAGAAARRSDDPARVPAALGHALASRHDLAGTARSRPGAATWWRSFPPATRCRRDVVEDVAARTGGVPLFVEEVTRLLLERGEGGGGIQAIPPTLQQSLMARLDRLGAAREVAQIGSVIGRGFSYSLLRDVAGMEDAPLQAALEKLAEADIVLVQGLPPESDYRFKHALIQDAAYENLLKSRRQILHRRVAEILRDRFSATATAEPEALAYHFTQAGMTDAAIEWWGKAGDQALRRSAFQEAISHLGKAIEMADKAGEAAPRAATTPASGSRRLKLQTSYGQALLWSKGFGAEETKTAFLRAQELAAGVDNADERFKILYGLWVGNLSRGEFVVGRETAEAFRREAENAARMTEAVVASPHVGSELPLAG